MDAARPRLFSAWDLLPVAALAGAWFWLRHWLPLLPEQIPSHWNAAGQVNGWMDKHSFFAVAAWPSLGLWVLLFGFALLLRGSDRPSRDLGLAALRALRAFLPVGFLVLMGFCAPLAGLYGGKIIGWGAGFFVLWLILGLIPVFRLVRLAPPIEGATHSDYRWGGLIYWNASDDRLLVPKRLGIGWDLNFGRPMAWVVIALLLFIPLILTVVSLVNR